MHKIISRWNRYIKRGVINEMLHVIDSDVASDIFNLMPKSVREIAIKEYGIRPYEKDFIFDFGFEKLNNKHLTKLNVFLIPDENGQLYYFEQIGLANPILRKANKKDDSLPRLPFNWYDGYLHSLEYHYKRIAENKKIKKNLSNIKTLAVFDFDDTLFRSPSAPAGHKGNWHIKIDSLTPPLVHKMPTKNMWHMDIVNKALRLCEEESVYCIMLTGRVDNIFEERIRELLLQQGLHFDFIRLNEFGGDTEEFKINTINKLINKMPNLINLIMWDDDEEKIEAYQEQFSDRDFSFNIHLVSDQPRKK